MTAARTSTCDRAQGLRALTAVLALYALVLQAVLGGIAALPTDAARDILCLQSPDGPARGDAGSGAARHHHAACCTLAPSVAAAAPPVPEVTAVAWPERQVARLSWTSEPVPSARAPPGTRASPRAPPLA